MNSFAADTQTHNPAAALFLEPGETVQTGLARVDPPDGLPPMPREQLEQVALVLGRMTPGERVTRETFDQLLAAIDETMSRQLDAILHAEDFRKVESAWRGLKMLHDGTRSHKDAGVEVKVVHATKEEIADDFENGLYDSTIFKNVFRHGYGMRGGTPCAAVISGHTFGLNNADLALLRKFGEMGRVGHTPFLATGEASLIGFDSMADATVPADLSDQIDLRGTSADRAEWDGFRDSEEARYVVLTAPRLLGRAPYDPGRNPARGVNYSERYAEESDLLWTSPSYGLGCNMARSFANYRWCVAIAETAGGGRLTDLPAVALDESPHAVGPLSIEAHFDTSAAHQVAQAGLSCVIQQPDRNEAFFDLLPTFKKPAKFDDSPAGKAAAMDEDMATHLPYLMLASRIAHYLKVQFEDRLGPATSPDQLKESMEAWLRTITVERLPKDTKMAERTPLKAFAIDVAATDKAGVYKLDLSVTPHQRFAGLEVALQLASNLTDTKLAG